jgi:hypothetical protein
MYTHALKTSGQRCYAAVWWPSKDKAIGAVEKQHPLVVLESGQITRVRRDNLEVIK